MGNALTWYKIQKTKDTHGEKGTFLHPRLQTTVSFQVSLGEINDRIL